MPKATFPYKRMCAGTTKYSCESEKYSIFFSSLFCHTPAIVSQSSLQIVR